MSRLLTIMLGVVVAFTASSANAAFTFAFDPAGTVLAPIGGSGSVKVNITPTGPDSAATLAGYSLTLLSSNAAFTFSSPFSGPSFSTAPAVITYSVAPGSPNPSATTVTGTFSYFSTVTGFQSGTISNQLPITAVPEPSSIALVGVCAVAGLVVNYRRRNKQKNA